MGFEHSSIPDGRRNFLRHPMALMASAGDMGKYSLERKFGFASAVPVTVATIYPENDLYTYPPSAATVTVSSGSANDTSAGTGAQTVRLFGLDGSYDEIQEDKTMNGQSGVTSSNSYLRVHRIQVLTAGASAKNEGAIYAGTGSITAGKPATVYGEIVADEGQTLQAVYTVPNNRTGYMEGALISVGTGKQFEGGIYVRPFGVDAFQIKQKIVLAAQGVYFPMDYLQVPTKSDVEVRGSVDASTAMVSASFTMYLQDTS